MTEYFIIRQSPDKRKRNLALNKINSVMGSQVSSVFYMKQTISNHTLSQLKTKVQTNRQSKNSSFY